MRHSLHKWLAWRRRRKRIRPSIAVAIVLGVLLLGGLAQWVGDVNVRRKLRSYNNESLLQFSRFQEVGYRKPAYYSDMLDGEAWDKYARALSGVESLDKGELKFITEEFMKGISHDTAKARQILVESDSIITHLKLGVRQRICTAPINYKNGDVFDRPSLISMRRAATLMACRARLSARRDPQGATEDIIDGIVLAQDIAGGELSAIGHMGGIICLQIFVDEAYNLLSEFYLRQPQLKRLASVISTLVNTWPALSAGLDGEWRMRNIQLDKFLLKKDHGPGRREQEPNRFYRRWTRNMGAWLGESHWREARVSAFGFRKKMIESLAESEAGVWVVVYSTLRFWQSRVDKSRNLYLTITTPNIMVMYSNQFVQITRARLAGAGALVEIHVLKHGHWPQSLEEAATEGLEDLLVDPMTGMPLKYDIYPGGDSVAVYSVGTNLHDDGGIMDEDKGDLVLILHQPERSP